MTAFTCPTPDCTSTRKAGQYLCWDCWDALPATARRALSIRDDLATARLQVLHRQLAAGTSPAEIEIRL
ncbi:hypothetical protein QFZ66_005842 [Streptomyces sp. B4I13]|uniref:hypothetical protein n=1 Tax=Streptomyces sp. B4I13 TaxID=3042271 RepID=UPI00278A8B10|nr:hypothetical protein [Streptomyces sp. B4I13]MDQ0961964.1 hypothetical protein [Streptomyces sp. B4I13]